MTILNQSSIILLITIITLLNLKAYSFKLPYRLINSKKSDFGIELKQYNTNDKIKFIRLTELFNGENKESDKSDDKTGVEFSESIEEGKKSIIITI